jgi:2-aminobenzoylacetyl-CoA thioesterase
MYKFPSLLKDNLWVLGNYYFNLYLVKGDKASALIEVGVSGVVDSIIEQLESLNINPKYLVITHPHPDHITGLAGLCEKFPNAKVVAGEGTKKFTSHPKSLNLLMHEDSYTTKILTEKGMKPKRPSIKSFQFPDEHIEVKDKHEIDLGGIKINFIKVNGHAPGQIIAHIPDMDALILSDSLGFHYPDRFFLSLYLTGFSEFMATLDYLESLKPKIIGIAHQCPISGEKEIKKTFKEAREAALNIFSMIIKGKDNKEKIAKELFKKYYKDELTLYSPENIKNCCNLLIKRTLEEV